MQIDEKTISELENMLAKRREELEKRSQAKPETKEKLCRYLPILF